MRALADRAGVALPDAGQRAPEVDGKLEALRRAMALAAEFYTRSLWEPGGEKPRAYLEQRGVDPEVAKRFGLGYAPESWNALLGVMARQGIGEDVLVQAGLILARQNAPGFYDRFRGRLLFPIRDVQGRVVAFGGRALSGEEPKYLNSPETPLYVKGQMLYALDVARDRDAGAEPRHHRRGLPRLPHGASARLRRDGGRARHRVHAGPARPAAPLRRRGGGALRRRRGRAEGLARASRR